MQWFPTEPEGETVMDRESMNDRSSATLGPQTRELTEAELDAASGGSWSLGAENPTASTQWSGSSGAGASKTAIIGILVG
jgi:hypothetical protein